MFQVQLIAYFLQQTFNQGGQTFPPLCTPLTSLTIFPSKSERAVAAEGAPQVHAGPPVQTGAIVAEMSFG